MVESVLVSEPDTLIDFERGEQGDLRTEEMLVNLGPQHPSTHGVMQVVLLTDGEMRGSR